LKLCILSSCGGHLTEVRELLPAYRDYPHFYVLDEPIPLPHDMADRTYIIRRCQRNWSVLVNLYQAWRILRRERPDVILSTGAGVCVSFAVVGRLLYGVRLIFVETFTRVTYPSLTGRIMYRIADRFFYQQEGLRKFFPKGTYAGTLM
jgi:beta-1,4-N-acetylglucosaminyltransferase